MLKFRHFSQGKKGFTLIELLLWISLFSIIFMAFFSVLEYVNNLVRIGDREDEILSSARYGIEYIKGEILSADRIIPIYKFEGLNSKYHNIFDFVILKITEIKTDNNIENKYNYNYATYYLKNDELIRIAINKETELLPNASEFSGHNQICTFVMDIDETELLISDRIIRLQLTMGDNKRVSNNFKTKIYLNCPIEM